MAAGFTLKDAVTLDDVQERGEALLLPLEQLFARYPLYRIAEPQSEARCRNGNPFSIPETLPDGLYRVQGGDGAFLCLSQLEGQIMTSRKNFFGA